MTFGRVITCLLICWFMTGCATAKLAQYATTVEPDPSMDKLILDCNKEALEEINKYKDGTKLSNNDYIPAMKRYDALKTIYDNQVEKINKAYDEELGAILADEKTDDKTKWSNASAVQLTLPTAPVRPELSSIPSAYKLDSFMNCFFDEKIAQDDFERRLLRGHYIVAALSRYGATSVMTYPIKPKRDATNILRRIENAEKLLKDGLDSLPNIKGEVKKVDRILAVQELVSESLKPFIRNSRSWFDNVISAIQGNPFKVLELAEDTGDIIKRTLRVKLFGSAFRQDISRKLKEAKNGNARLHWDYFNETLETACTTLGSIANVKHQCIVK
jgi:hypothetical protein